MSWYGVLMFRVYNGAMYGMVCHGMVQGRVYHCTKYNTVCGVFHCARYSKVCYGSVWRGNVCGTVTVQASGVVKPLSIKPPLHNTDQVN